MAAVRLGVDLLCHLLGRLARRARLLLGVGEDLPGLLLGVAPLLRPVAVHGRADVARVLLGLGARALGLAGEVLDPGGRIGAGALDDLTCLCLRLAPDLLRGLLCGA